MSPLTVIALILVILLFLATLGASLMIYPIFWKYSRDAWRRIPADRRPRALAGGAFVVLVVAVFGLLLYLEPWGSDTIAWVVVTFAGAIFLWGLAIAVSQASRASRNTGRRRLSKHSEP
jgi:predicted permease